MKTIENYTTRQVSIPLCDRVHDTTVALVNVKLSFFTGGVNTRDRGNKMARVATCVARARAGQAFFTAWCFFTAWKTGVLGNRAGAVLVLCYAVLGIGNIFTAGHAVLCCAGHW